MVVLLSLISDKVVLLSLISDKLVHNKQINVFSQTMILYLLCALTGPSTHIMEPGSEITMPREDLALYHCITQYPLCNQAKFCSVTLQHQYLSYLSQEQIWENQLIVVNIKE